MSKISESFIHKCLRCDQKFISRSKVIRLCEQCKYSIRREGLDGVIPVKGNRNSAKSY